MIGEFWRGCGYNEASMKNEEEVKAQVFSCPHCRSSGMVVSLQKNRWDCFGTG